MHLSLRLVAILGVLLLLLSISSSHAISLPKNNGLRSYNIWRGKFLTKYTVLGQRDNVVRTNAIENETTGTTESSGLKLPRTPAAPRIIKPRPGLKTGGGSPKVVNNPAAGRTKTCRRADESCDLLEKTYREKYTGDQGDPKDQFPSIYDKYADPRDVSRPWAHKELVIKEFPLKVVCRYAIREDIYITKYADTRDYGFEQLKYSDIMYFNMRDSMYLPWVKTLVTDIILEPKTRGAIERAFTSRGLDFRQENDVTFSNHWANSNSFKPGWTELVEDNPFLQGNQKLVADRAEDMANPWIESVDVYSRPNSMEPNNPTLYMVTRLDSVEPRTG